MVWNGGMHRLSLAAGIYHQEILGFNDRRNAGDIFTAWSASPPGLVPEAKHFIAGWRISPSDWLSVSLEGFYKELTDLLVPEWTAFPRFTTNIQEADGSALGGDARLEITTDVFYSVFSYGLSDVEYESTFRGQQLLFGDDKTKYPPPHDRRHQVNVLANLSKWNFDLSVRYQFGSGLPFNQSLGFDRYVLLDSLTNVAEEEGSARVLYTRPYTGRLPAYHRFDVSLDYEISFSPRAAATIQAGVINVSDRRNLFYVDLFTLRRVDQLPLIPTLGVKIEFK
jgi:hypothetical protein